MAAESHAVVDPVLTVQPSIPGSAEQHDHRHDDRAESVTCAPAERPCQSHFAAEPSTSTAEHVAIKVISPIPKADRTERRPQSKSRGHTAVITCSPLGRTRERYWEKLPTLLPQSERRQRCHMRVYEKAKAKAKTKAKARGLLAIQKTTSLVCFVDKCLLILEKESGIRNRAYFI